MNRLEDKTFLLLVIAISLAFAWIIWPFYGAVLWATVLAIVFAPLYRRLSGSMRQRRNLAALVTVVIIVLIVILPSTLVTGALVQEASGVYEMFKSGELNLARGFQHVLEALPSWAVGLLDRFGLTDLAGVQEGLSAGLGRASQFIAAQALNIGQATFELVVRMFVMLYLLFFLLRDGDELFRIIKDAVPLRPEQQRAIFSKFATVIRATVKGTIVVALLQGALGGLMFWFLGIRAALLWGALVGLGVAVGDVVGQRVAVRRPARERQRGERRAQHHEDRAAPRLVVAEDPAPANSPAEVQRHLQRLEQVQRQHRGVQDRRAQHRDEDEQPAQRRRGSPAPRAWNSTRSSFS